MLANLCFRVEEPKDYHVVEELTRDAFWNKSTPGADEHFLLYKMRNHIDYLKDISLIAVDQETKRILGSICYTKSFCLNSKGNNIPTLTFGPISVHPNYQRQGIGRELIEQSVKQIKALYGNEYKAIVIYGDPAYYGRLGFKCGQVYDLRTETNEYNLCMLVLPLDQEIIEQSLLKECTFQESEIFQTFLSNETNEFEEYDQQFPSKEKESQNQTQIRFQILCSLHFPAQSKKFIIK